MLDVEMGYLAKFRRLREQVAGLPGAVVALSGGVDSAVLLHVCAEALGPDRVVAFTADSPAVPRSELEDAAGLARLVGVAHQRVPTHEMDLPDFACNTPRRCAACKAHLVERFQEVARERGLSWPLLLGAHADDLGEQRPGEEVARLMGVRMPLQEAGITKDEIRGYARKFWLPAWDKPSSPCLATRIRTGDPITVERLGRVEAAEAALHALGLRHVRVRDHGELARVEMPLEKIPAAAAPPLRQKIVAALVGAGFRHATLDLSGYTQGSMAQGPGDAAGLG